MAHGIEMTLPDRIKIKNADVVFEIRHNRTLIGKVKMSRGGLEYTPTHKQSKGTIRKSWPAFDRLIRGI
jgi:hypothetical protein